MLDLHMRSIRCHQCDVQVLSTVSVESGQLTELHAQVCNTFTARLQHVSNDECAVDVAHFQVPSTVAS